MRHKRACMFCHTRDFGSLLLILKSDSQFITCPWYLEAIKSTLVSPHLLLSLLLVLVHRLTSLSALISVDYDSYCCYYWSSCSCWPQQQDRLVDLLWSAWSIFWQVLLSPCPVSSYLIFRSTMRNPLGLPASYFLACHWVPWLALCTVTSLAGDQVLLLTVLGFFLDFCWLAWGER